MISSESGSPRWELPIIINEGKSKLERIVDIDGKVVVANDLFVAASYQGHITAIDLQQGRPIWQEKISTTKDLVEAKSRVVAIDDKDIMKAFGLSSGVILWQQEGLKLRGLTSPVNIRGNIAGEVRPLNSNTKCCGMVWCVVACCGVLWHGVVCCGMLWCVVV
jgi:outer membrane protein assembly factor BamB